MVKKCQNLVNVVFGRPLIIFSFKLTAFDEILQLGRDQKVDFVLLGGDLFHDNRPTRNAEHQCMKILKKHVFGDRPVSVEFVSDPEMNFEHCDPNHR